MNNAPLYNSRIFTNYVEYISEVHPKIDMPALLERVGFDPLALADHGHWFSQAEADAFAAEAIRATGNPNIARDVGRNLAFSKHNGPLRQYSLGLLGPATLFGIIGRLSPRLSRGADLSSKTVGRRKLEVVAVPRPGITEKTYQCDNRLGSFESLTRMFTGEWPRVEHPECVHRGAKACRYIISWRRPPWRPWQVAASVWLTAGTLAAIGVSVMLPMAFIPLTGAIWCAVAALLAWMNARTRLRVLTENVKRQGEAGESVHDELQHRHADAGLVQQISQTISGILDKRELLQAAIEMIHERLNFDRATVLLPDQDNASLEHVAMAGFDAETRSVAEGHSFRIDTPSAISNAFRNKEAVFYHTPDDSQYQGTIDNKVARQLRIHSLTCIPIAYEHRALGVIALDKSYSKGDVTRSEVRVLCAIAAQLAVSLVNADAFRQLQALNKTLSAEVQVRQNAERELRHHQLHLEELVDERTAELRSAQSRLIDASRIAGKFEVASGIVHNVGNVLNSVGVAAELLREQLEHSRLNGLQRAIALLTANAEHLGTYITTDPRGKQLPIYLSRVTDALVKEQTKTKEDMITLSDRLDHVKRIIAAQETYSRGSAPVREHFLLSDVVHTAIKITEAQVDADDIRFVCDFAHNPALYADRHQLLQIVTNLVANAVQAVREHRATKEKTVRVSLGKRDARNGVVIEVVDNGIGIPHKDLTRVFQHGYTTKREGNGFGLHASALSAKQMGGSIVAESPGPRKGARFLVRLPESLISSEKDAPQTGPEFPSVKKPYSSPS